MRKLPIIRNLAVFVAIVIALGVCSIMWRSTATATPPKSPPPRAAKPASTAKPPPSAAAPSAPVVQALATTTTTTTNTDAGAGTLPAVRDTARIVFSTTPGVTATVTWGKKLLGVIAPHQSLVVVRPRDSGPLDVMVRAPGYLPVQTRAHTFSDSRVVVKLTPPDQKNTLIGYRAPIDAGPPPATEDGGMPSLTSEVNAPLPSAAAPPSAASH
jgi:hypothetical protein